MQDPERAIGPLGVTLDRSSAPVTSHNLRKWLWTQDLDHHNTCSSNNVENEACMPTTTLSMRPLLDPSIIADIGPHPSASRMSILRVHGTTSRWQTHQAHRDLVQPSSRSPLCHVGLECGERTSPNRECIVAYVRTRLPGFLNCFRRISSI